MNDSADLLVGLSGQSYRAINIPVDSWMTLLRWLLLFSVALVLEALEAG